MGEREDDFAFEVMQRGIVVAMGSGNDLSQVHAEALHYGMMYGQDGPCTVRVFRTSAFADPDDFALSPPGER